ncbi:MAG: hypothetical protein U9R00_01465 [Patescibacteria group bacterium]|nr:hypothetical protein [Patescibacteria group bacterium]
MKNLFVFLLLVSVIFIFCECERKSGKRGPTVSTHKVIYPDSSSLSEEESADNDPPLLYSLNDFVEGICVSGTIQDDDSDMQFLIWSNNDGGCSISFSEVVTPNWIITINKMYDLDYFYEMLHIDHKKLPKTTIAIRAVDESIGQLEHFINVIKKLEDHGFSIDNIELWDNTPKMDKR